MLMKSIDHMCVGLNMDSIMSHDLVFILIQYHTGLITVILQQVLK